MRNKICCFNNGIMLPKCLGICNEMVWRVIPLILFKMLTLSLLLSVLAVVPDSFGTETVLVNKTFSGREIKARAGGFIRIDLEELGSAGYAWAVKELDREFFEIVSIQTLTGPTSGDVTGTPVVRSWLIRTLKPGKSELKLFHYRPWEGEEKATDHFFLTVRIL